MLRVPELQKPYPLPRPCIQPPVCNRDRHARSDQRALDVRGHVIAAFCVVSVESPCSPFLGRDPVVFGDDAVEGVGHVGADIGVVVLVERERAGCVLDEEGEQAGFVGGDFGELGVDVRGYEVGAPAARGEGEGFLEPGTFKISIDSVSSA